MRPKVLGGWLLHSRLRDLDFFVEFSSVGALLGQAGQGSYAAANAFLDALAHQRRRENIAGLSINWGPWSGLGLAATAGGLEVSRSLREQGIRPISADEGLKALEHVLAHVDGPQTSVLPLDPEALWASSPAAARFIGELANPRRPADRGQAVEDAPQPAQAGLGETLAALPADQRRPALQKHLQQEVGRVLRMPPARVTPSKPLGTMGLDSLMTLELRRRLEDGLQIALSATFVWNYPTIAELAPYLLTRMGLGTETPGPTPTPVAHEAPEAPAEPQLDELLTNIAALSDEGALESLLGKQSGREP